MGRAPNASSRISDQIELQFEELESSATEDEIAAEIAVAKTTTVAAFTCRRARRKPFPEHLPRERVIGSAGTDRLPLLRRRGGCASWAETVTETLESIPRQWKVIQYAREKFTCRGLREDQPGSGAVPCDRQGLSRPQSAGDDPVREVRQHQPLNRQAERYAKEGAAELVDPG